MNQKKKTGLSNNKAHHWARFEAHLPVCLSFSVLDIPVVLMKFLMLDPPIRQHPHLSRALGSPAGLVRRALVILSVTQLGVFLLLVPLPEVAVLPFFGALGLESPSGTGIRKDP